MTPDQKMTQFQKLCELKPQLHDLYEEAKAVKDDPSKPAFCANAVWYGFGCWDGRGLKARLGQLVDGLKDHLAEDLATDVIYDALPDCRNCGCP